MWGLIIKRSKNSIRAAEFEIDITIIGSVLPDKRVIMHYARKCSIAVPSDFEDFPSYRLIIQREALKWNEVVAL